MAHWWDENIYQILGIRNPVASAATNWFNSAGGAIGAGLESAGVALLRDLWDVILGALEVIAGAVLAIMILLFIFRDDLASVATAMTRY